MEITNELRARIFAAYWGCQVSHPCDRAGFEYRGVRHLPDDSKQQYGPILFGDWSGGHLKDAGLLVPDESAWQEAKNLIDEII